MSYPLPAPGTTRLTAASCGTDRSPGNCPIPGILCFFTLLLCEELIFPHQDSELSCAERPAALTQC